MRIRASGNYWDDPRDAKLRTLLNSPLHTVELKDGENEGNLCQARSGNLFAEIEFDAAVADDINSSAPHGFSSRNVEILSDAGAQHAHQMVRMLADHGSAVTQNFVGDKAAAGHGSGLRSQFPVPSSQFPVPRNANPARGAVKVSEE